VSKLFTITGPVEKTDTCSAPQGTPSFFEMILAHVPEGIVVQDIEGRIEWANPAFERMFGWPLADILGRRPHEFLLPPESCPSAARIAAFRYRLDSPIFRHPQVSQHMRRDGSRFWNQQCFTVLPFGPDADEDRKKVVVFCRDVTDQIHAERAARQIQVDLEHAAYHDDLTGLANRKRLKSFLLSPSARAQLATCEIGALQLDIDNFKQINDTLGHAAGDATLLHVASAMRASCGRGDLICRTGGDEFLQLCPGISSREALIDRAERLRAAIDQPMRWNAHRICISTSIGASLAGPRPGMTGETLIQMADQALYAAKTGARGRIVCYTEDMGRAQLAETRLARDLVAALDEPQFEIHLQPQLCIAGKRIIGCEALLRWVHPVRGLLAPGAFLPVAEKNGLLAQIDYISMNLALDALLHLREAGLDTLQLSINVSASILADAAYPDRLAQALLRRRLAPEDICIEILETTVLNGSVPGRSGLDVTGAVDRIKHLGARVALDDFGTGHAGLANMSAVDIDAIKLDQLLIARLEEDGRSRAIVQSIIRLAAHLGVQAIAEGVETQAQFDILRRARCPVIQGYGLARPMPVAACIDWLRDNTRPGGVMRPEAWQGLRHT
jgi:diguanylate cyclase (GGDEF)-like protein/PAS domain S-box-containing protein